MARKKQEQATGSGGRAADMLQEFVDGQTKAKISLEDFVSALGGRAFGLAMLILALANLLIANLPGLSTVLGLPIVLLSLQIVLGRSDFWLPQRIREIRIPRDRLEGMVGRAVKILSKLEKLIKPRLGALASDKAERWLGGYCLLLGIVLMLPILFGNFLPAWAIALIALGLIEKDGLFILFGLVTGLAAMVYAVAFFAGGAELIRSFMP